MSRKLIRIAGLACLIGILIAIYIFKYAAQTIVLKKSDGSWLFGYDKKQSKWLMNEFPEHELGIDGPYILYRQQYVEVMQVKHIAGKEILSVDTIVNKPAGIYCVVDNVNRDSFYVPLKKSLTTDSSIFAMPSRMFVISDIEGNMKAFVELLAKNNVIDKQLNWAYGNGHLVLVGDFMDRGINVTQCLWLIYKLEDEAIAVGGRVHFILGNHEQLNLQGYAEYAKGKYIEVARRYRMPYKSLYSDNTELGRWLRTKNVIEKTGDILFVHGGISKDVAALKIGIGDINRICRGGIDKKEEALKDDVSTALLGHMGVLWFRGMVQDYKNYTKLNDDELKTILMQFGARAIVVGHSIVDNVSADYGGRVIRTDVKHSEVIPQALYIENDKFYCTDNVGRLREIE